MADVESNPKRDDRLLRYGARPLDQSQWILIRVEHHYAATYAGQIATLVAANLIGRLSRSVAIDVPQIPIVDPIPGTGRDLAAEALATLSRCDPWGRYESWNDQADAPYVVHLGPDGHEEIVHGMGWLAFLGPPRSPIASEGCDPYNPVGPAFAAVAAATHLFVHKLQPPRISRLYDCYAWQQSDGSGVSVREGRPSVPLHLELGDLWTVGCGSVGSAILYFLGLSGVKFSTSLFDMDHVKEENITRSPIFKENDIGNPKVTTVADFLRECGIDAINEYPVALDESDVWLQRSPGVPDLLIPAANERNVRHLIENNFPPLQIYGATGTNWQASVISHVPMITGCSLCLFPDDRFPETVCATNPGSFQSHDVDVAVDASLPFLSFSAGLMAASEILKVACGSYVHLGQRGIYSTWEGPRLTPAPARRRPECVCSHRDANLYSSLLRGGRYAISAGV